MGDAGPVNPADEEGRPVANGSVAGVNAALNPSEGPPATKLIQTLPDYANEDLAIAEHLIQAHEELTAPPDIISEMVEADLKANAEAAAIAPAAKPPPPKRDLTAEGNVLVYVYTIDFAEDLVANVTTGAIKIASQLSSSKFD